MGRVLLVCGSKGMAGAALLSATAALRAGAGYAVVAAPGAIAAELSAGRPEAVLQLCGDTERRHFEAADVGSVLEAAAQAQAVVIGPGLGQEVHVLDFIAALLPALAGEYPQVPLVLDADGLNAVAELGISLSEFGFGQLLLTPHPGEAARLLGAGAASTNVEAADSNAADAKAAARTAATVQADREGAIRTLVQRHRAAVLLKGADTLILAPDQILRINPTGNPGMATAGSGDVLSGLLGALCARGMDIYSAAVLGAWLHGRAGDLAAAQVGMESVIASDMNHYLPQAVGEAAAAC